MLSSLIIKDGSFLSHRKVPCEEKHSALDTQSREKKVFKIINIEKDEWNEAESRKGRSPFILSN